MWSFPALTGVRPNSCGMQTVARTFMEAARTCVGVKLRRESPLVMCLLTTVSVLHCLGCLPSVRFCEPIAHTTGNCIVDGKQIGSAIYTAGEYPFGRVVRRDARLVHMGGRFRFAQPALWVEAPPHTALKQGGLA